MRFFFPHLIQQAGRNRIAFRTFDHGGIIDSMKTFAAFDLDRI